MLHLESAREPPHLLLALTSSHHAEQEENSLGTFLSYNVLNPNNTYREDFEGSKCQFVWDRECKHFLCVMTPHFFETNLQNFLSALGNCKVCSSLTTVTPSKSSTFSLANFQFFINRSGSLLCLSLGFLTSGNTNISFRTFFSNIFLKYKFTSRI